MSDVHAAEAIVVYTHYFKVLDTMSKILHECVVKLSRGRNAQMFERAFVDFIERFAYTSHALRVKYAFSHASLSGEVMRIRRSGFPSHVEINDLLIDFVQQHKTLGMLETTEVLKGKWLKRVKESGIDDVELLWRIGERRYHDLLNPDKMMLPVVTGDFELRGETDTDISFAFWWTCYDPSSNSPCIHVLEATQDRLDDSDSVFENGPERERFLQTIRNRGNRAPNVSVMACDLDIALPNIHPKCLTRIQADKLFSAAVTDAIPNKSENDIRAGTLLQNHAREGDFILHLIRDMVRSKGQTKGTFFMKQVAEVFDLESTADANAIERGATTTDEFLILPHTVAQSCVAEKEDSFVLFRTASQKLAYSNGGHVDAIE